MKKYMVLYKTRDQDGFDKPLGFAVETDSVDNAAKACGVKNAPCTVIHISEKETVDAAYEEWLFEDEEVLGRSLAPD